ncbi:MAG: T9SS type A sorting domain-containing protein [Bacteroidota bacterium]
MKKLLLILLAFLFINNVNSQTLTWQSLGTSTEGAFCFTKNSTNTKLYRSTYGVFMSVDSGATWQNIFPWSGSGVFSAIVKGDTLFAEFSHCSGYEGIKYTVDDGQNWIRIDNGFAGTFSVYALAANQTTIYAAAYDAVYYTNNTGQTWQMYSTPHAAGGAYSVCTDGNNICVGSSGRVFISNDNGITWNMKLLPLPFGYIAWKVHMEGNKIFAATGGGLFCSLDNGNSWTLMGMSGENVVGLLFYGQYIFASTSKVTIPVYHDAHVYFSSDSGSTWMQADNGIPSPDEIFDFILFDNKIIAGTGYGTSGIFYTNLNSLGINSFNSNENNVAIFPNPANDFITIQYDFNAEMIFSLYNSFGQQISSKSFAENSKAIQIATNTFSNGIYYWNLTNKSQVVRSGKVAIVK